MAALTAALLAASAFGTYAQAQAQRNQGEYQARSLDQNAALADQQATDALARGTEAAQRVRLQGRQVVGAQRVGYGAQGVDVASGTPRQLQGDTAAMSELDALTLQNNAAREAWGYQVEAAQTRGQAGLVRTASRNAYRSTLLTGGAQMLAQAPDALGSFGRSAPAPFTAGQMATARQVTGRGV